MEDDSKCDMFVVFTEDDDMRMSLPCFEPGQEVTVKLLGVR